MTPEQLIEKLKAAGYPVKWLMNKNYRSYFKIETTSESEFRRIAENLLKAAERDEAVKERDEAVRERDELRRRVEDVRKLTEWMLNNHAVTSDDRYGYSGKELAQKIQAILTGEGEG